LTDDIGGLAIGINRGEMKQAAIDHLHGDRRERQLKLFGHGIRDVHQDGI
jgi:hypothetical protein